MKIFSKTIEDKAIEQINKIASMDIYKDAHIRIMPDCHAGAGCVIGTTMLIKDKITPNLVGVDIGCGVLTIVLKNKNIDLEKLDNIITKHIPSGFGVHKTRQIDFDFSKLHCKNHINIERAKLSIGTLGGGNHFIEIEKDYNNFLYLVIHSGSRNLGYQVAKYYQDKAILNLKNKYYQNNNNIINKLKAQGKYSEIQKILLKLSKRKTQFDKELAYIEGDDFNNYINDMKITQKYAKLNRMTIANIILQKMGIEGAFSFETIHNYIDFKRMILRKGAISAENNELLLIPINMKDGSLFVKGKGNPDWNYSAPHGAGRLLSRKKAKELLSLDSYKKQMGGIYTSSVNEHTLDESPDAYKSIDEIKKAVKDTADIICVLKPIYNYKAH